ncbi:MAG: NADP-dependent 3-hydroxy acid dehydrogenase YdfG [Actinomycetota bacterium]
MATALITGASSGIGKELARALAARGYELILVARRKDRLTALASELKSAHKVGVSVYAADLSKPGATAALEKSVRKDGHSVDVLVNNAGFGTNNRVINEDRATVADEIALNIGALVDLTIAFLPDMVTRGFGAVINIASTASYQPVPGMAVYAATKAFVRSFTEATWGEVPKGVKVFAVSPGATATEFFDIAGANPSSALAPTSDVIDVIVAQLESASPAPSTIVGGRNRILARIAQMVPRKASIRVAGSMFLPKN